MRILNLYAGIGGNRKLWGDEHQITAVENVDYIADAYKQLFPDDEVVVADAHQYLLDHHQEFDLIWSSPPCPTHSRLSTTLSSPRYQLFRYPDMKLWQEIIFLKHFYKGKWVVENVEPYYKPALHPALILDRHVFWANFYIPKVTNPRLYSGEISNQKATELSEGLDITLPAGTKNQLKLLRNAVDPRLGLHIIEAAKKTLKQEILI